MIGPPIDFCLIGKLKCEILRIVFNGANENQTIWRGLLPFPIWHSLVSSIKNYTQTFSLNHVNNQRKNTSWSPAWFTRGWVRKGVSFYFTQSMRI